MIESNMAGALRATVLPKRFFDWILPFFRLTVVSLARVVHDVTAVQRQQVGRFAGIHIDHGPHGTRITVNLPVLPVNGIVTVGKQTVHILHLVSTEISSY